MRFARVALALLASFWILLLLTAPLAAFGAPVSALVYGFGSLLCHQRPERSFHLASSQLPVCARCFGLYVGAAAGLLIPWSGTSLAALRAGLIGAALPTAVTWTGELLGLWAPANMTRFAAALPLGAAAGLTVNYVRCARTRRTELNSPRIRI